MHTLGTKEAAILLRKKGKTYSEIQAKIGPLAKGTLSRWLKPIKLTASQKDRIQKKINDRGALGRQKGGWTNHQKRILRINRIQEIAKEQFLALSKDTIFLSGLVLYLAEGSKKTERFEFMNSDPCLIKFMIRWLKQFNKITNNSIKARLYIHAIYSDKEHERFWAKFLKIGLNQFHKTIYKPTVHVLKKNPEYRGCLRIEIKNGSELYWKIMKWRDMFYADII